MSACSNTVSEGAGVVGNGDENADDIIRGDTVAKIDRRVNTGDVAGCICCSNVGDSNSLRNDVRANNRSGWFMMSDMWARELRTRKVSPVVALFVSRCGYTYILSLLRVLTKKGRDHKRRVSTETISFHFIPLS